MTGLALTLPGDGVEEESSCALNAHGGTGGGIWVREDNSAVEGAGGHAAVVGRVEGHIVVLHQQGCRHGSVEITGISYGVSETGDGDGDLNLGSGGGEDVTNRVGKRNSRCDKW